jgi:polyphosphate kinase
MPRNLEKRVEILFPVEQEDLKKEVIHILDIELQDNVKAHVLQPDDTYVKVDRRGKVSLSSQDYFVEEAREKARVEEPVMKSRVFIPEQNHDMKGTDI